MSVFVKNWGIISVSVTRLEVCLFCHKTEDTAVFFARLETYLFLSQDWIYDFLSHETGNVYIFVTETGGMYVSVTSLKI